MKHPPVPDEVSKPEFEATRSEDMKSDMAFPCSQKNCTEFHENTHGFCHRHRFHRFWRTASVKFMKACRWMELMILLIIQAATEIQSRVLLILILLSLLPVTCLFLEQSTGMSAASICITFLVVAVGSCFYTAKRLDGMQQRVFHAALATEANYFQVLRPVSEASGNLVQVCSILRNHSDCSSGKVLQNTQDLRSNYKQAQLHLSHFQSTVCDPLALAGHEVMAKIKSVAELDEGEGAVDVLCCEVLCDSLQQVQDAWEVLKDLAVEIVSAEDFFATASSMKCCKIVVSVQGYFATIFLKEKVLSSWETQKGISDAATSLGLLDKTVAASWEVSRRSVSKVPKCVLAVTVFLRLAAFLSCFVIVCYIHFAAYNRHDDGSREIRDINYWTLWKFVIALPFWICFAVFLWEMLCSCCLCWKNRSFRIRPRPTQVWYRKYLGVQGSHYAFKVAALQLITVLFQGFAKASLFQAIWDTHDAETLESSNAAHCFMGLLLCNVIFPAVVLAFPNCCSSRVGAAVMDAVLDLGYMTTSLWLYIGFAKVDSLDLIFFHSFWNYMSLYISIAHVLCVCRSLETADWGALLQVQSAATWRPWKRMLISLVYVCILVGMIGMMMGGTVLNAFFSFGFGGLCPPCQCSAIAPRALRLDRCIIRTHFVAATAPALAFNLTNRNIVDVEQLAFALSGASGNPPEVTYLSLRGNRLTYLPEGLFSDVRAQGFLHVMDLGYNKLTALVPEVLGWFPKSWPTTPIPRWFRIGQLHLDGNLLTTLPPGVFFRVEVGQLYLQNNHLTELHNESLRLSWWGFKPVLDMSSNKLETLPRDLFNDDQHHKLWEINLGHNKLSALPAYIFYLRELRTLNLQNNRLRRVDFYTFYRTYLLARLNLEQNQLSHLDMNVFHNSRLALWELKLGGNQLTTLPDGLFWEFRKLRHLELQRNQLQQLPPQIFQILGCTLDSHTKIAVRNVCIREHIDMTYRHN